MSAPNVILICVDQWRGDCLSSAGHPDVRTPHLDRLAASGTHFEAAYSATPTCVPARAALLTGQSQERHGRVGYVEGVPFDRAHPVTLPGEFRRGGYQTQAIGKMHVWPERSRVGFDDVLLHDGFLHFARARGQRDVAFYDDYTPWLRRQPGAGPDSDHTDHGAGCNSLVARPWDKPEHLHPTSWLAERTVEWLYRRDPTRPFFLYLSFHRPHPPYDPPAWAFEDYLGLPPYEPAVGDWADDFADWHRDGDHEAFAGRMDARTLHRARAGYYGHMAHIDLQIHRIRLALADFGLADDTVICFTSDHGEMLGEHHLFRKGFGFEGSARVPLLFGPLPGGQPAGGVASEVVELRDVMPTLLELAGLPVPEECDGRSLVPFLRDERPARWREFLHGEHVLFDQSLQWVTDGRTKYLWMSGTGREQLFDLVADPHELHNLAADPAAGQLLLTWRGHLVRALTGREEGFVAEGSLVTGRPVVNILRHTRERIGAAAAG
ncbi:arylsulfatase [Streptomyces sp. NPDC019224]|uniref:arylsulfatase n=1 Tax=Streptomyces sp. NPDC019224 TaxID=3154484 RepID=UPI0033F76C3B